MKGKIYKISDAFFIYEDNNGRDKLMYIVDPLNERYIPILDMEQVERKVNERIQTVFRFLDRYVTPEDLNFIELFVFLLRVRLYEEYIGNNMIVYMPLNEYERIIDSNYLAFIIAQYLSDKGYFPYEENIAIIKNFNKFNKLYSLFKDSNFEISGRYMRSLYNRFLDLMKTEI